MKAGRRELASALYCSPATQNLCSFNFSQQKYNTCIKTCQHFSFVFFVINNLHVPRISVIHFLLLLPHGIWIGGAIEWTAFRTEYLAYSQTAKNENTHYRDRKAIESLEAFLKPATLESITQRGLEFWRNSRVGKSHPILNRDLAAIKAMLHKAKSWGYIKDEFWHEITLLKVPRGRLLWYSVEEFNRILRCCKCRHPELVRGHDRPYSWATVAMLAARAGLRRSEIRFLSFDDLDFERNILTVCPKEGWHPKDFETRYIPISADLKEHLLGLPRDSEWVLWPRPSLATMSVYFRKIVARAGLKGGIHTLRHTFASWLVQSGVPLYEVSKLLGHSSVEMTSVYAHLAPNNLAEAIGKLPSLGAVK